MLTLPSFAGPTSARSVTRTVRMRFSVGTSVTTPKCLMRLMFFNPKPFSTCIHSYEEPIVLSDHPLAFLRVSAVVRSRILTKTIDSGFDLPGQAFS